MKYKVLIVEDEEVIANTIKKQLESWNMEADCVEDFHNVLGKFVDYEPQLVDGYFVAFPKWISLVPGNQKGFQGTNNFFVFHVRQYEYGYGNEYGGR